VSPCALGKAASRSERLPSPRPGRTPAGSLRTKSEGKTRAKGRLWEGGQGAAGALPDRRSPQARRKAAVKGRKQRQAYECAPGLLSMQVRSTISLYRDNLRNHIACV
jgi:hypothetical protein